MAGGKLELDVISTPEALTVLESVYGMPHDVVVQLDNILQGDAPDILERLPYGSPWGEPANIQLLAERIYPAAPRESTRRKRPTYVIAERISDAIDAAFPLSDGEKERYHLGFTRVAAHLLADEELASNRSTIAWVGRMLEAAHDHLLGPSLAAIIRTAPFTTLEHASESLCEMVYLRAEDGRTKDLWEVAALRLAWARRGEDPERLLAILGGIEALEERVVQILFGEVLHPNIDQRLRNEMLHHTLRLAGFMQARNLLSRIGDPSHIHLIPGLVSVGKHSPTAATQRAILSACVRIGSPIAEPLVLELLAHPSSGMRYNAVEAAGALGTRRCLERLVAIEAEDGEIAARARRAIEAIEERYPAAKFAIAGGLSLSEDESARGALTLSLPDEGAISLYEEVEEILKTNPRANTENLPQVAGANSTALSTSTTPAWYKLEVAPRRVPASARAELFYRQNLPGMLSIPFIGFASIFVWIPELLWLPHIWIFLVAGIIAAVFAARRANTRSRALALGHPSFADHQRCEYITQGNNKILVQHFGYMTEEGEYVEQSRKFEGKLLPQMIEDKLESRPTSPVLYLPDATASEREDSSNVVFIDDFKSIQVSQNGDLEGNTAWVTVFGFLALMQLLMLASFFFRILAIFL